MTTRESIALVAVALPAAAALALVLLPARTIRSVALTTALVTGVLAAAASALAVVDSSHPIVGSWFVLDAAGGLFFGVIGVVGLASVVFSPSHLDVTRSSIFPSASRERLYFVVLFGFWASLLAVPLAGNLGAAWLLVEATTATSALLVGYSGKAHALEAGWKYLILTSLGLGVALLGIVVLAAGVPGHGLSRLTWAALPGYSSGASTALTAYLLLLAGLAAKIGWAPVHNWLPDAHSEAPPPVSALLSAALLPAVLLVAWRSEQALAPAVGTGTAQAVLIGFGLVSLAIAVPFLWRPLAWKRLLAYSSLEHMGVLALGVGFASPLALAGVAIHLCAHAVAKALGFYAATPLLVHEPRAARHTITGIARTNPKLGTAMAVSLGALAGLPPSPLFFSELLIVAGGFQAGHAWTAGASAILLALGFLGLAHALLETVVGNARRRVDGHLPGLRLATVLTAVSILLLLALSASAEWLPHSSLVGAFAKGLS